MQKQFYVISDDDHATSYSDEKEAFEWFDSLDYAVERANELATDNPGVRYIIAESIQYCEVEIGLPKNIAIA